MTQNYQVFGMMCAACASHVESAVSKVEGVQSVSVNLLTSAMRVVGEAPAEAIVSAVKKAGYSAKYVETPVILPLNQNQTCKKLPLILSLCFSLILFIVAIGYMFFPMPGFLSPDKNPVSWLLLQWPLSLFVALLHYRYFKGGVRSLLSFRPNMDSLIAIGAGASLLYSTVILFLTLFFPMKVSPTKAEFSASAMILSLVTLGKTLEGNAKDKTVGAITKLSALVPDEVYIKKGDREVLLPLSSLTKEDTLLLKVGQRIPTDGKITKGFLTVDESALTGESLPKDRKAGDTVLAGTVVLDGYAEAVPTAIGEETALSATVRMVSEAAATKAPIARFADRVSLFFVPAVLGIAILTFVCHLCLGQGAGYALDRAVSVLVVSCPCALGLATPTAMVVAMGRGAELGILVKDAESMENLGKIKQVAFDKTGTLTTGKLHLCRCICVSSKTEDELLALAAALEKGSTHPIAKVLTKAAEGLPQPKMDTIKAVNGKGIFGKNEDGRYMLGNAALMEDAEIDLSPLAPYENDLKAKKEGILYLASAEGLLGAFRVSDTLKDDAEQAISALHGMKISTLLLSGDSQDVANGVAQELGIERVFAPLLPAEKAEIIEKERKNTPTAMVADGINDAPALLAADVGIAMGRGTDIAIESAGAVLRFDKPTDVVKLIRLGKVTLKKIKQNLFFALVYNVICIPVAAGVFSSFGFVITPMIAAAAMACSSLTVVTNALSIKRFS